MGLKYVKIHLVFVQILSRFNITKHVEYVSRIYHNSSRWCLNHVLIVFKACLLSTVVIRTLIEASWL